MPQTARLLAQNGARQNGLTGAEVAPFVDRVLSILANLSEADAATTYGITADEYRTWAEHCGWAAGASAPASPPFTVHGSPLAATHAPQPAPETPPSAPSQSGSGGRPDRQSASGKLARHPPQSTPPPTPAYAQPHDGSGSRPDRHLSPKDAGNSANSTSDRFTDSATAATTAPSPAAPPSLNSQPSTLNSAVATPAATVAPPAWREGSGDRPDRHPAVADPASTPEARLRELLAQAKDVRLSWFWSKRWPVSNHIVTGRRLLVATLWAAPWMYLQQHNVAFAMNAGWAVVVLIPLPWIVFRWLDHPTQGPLTTKTAVGLGVGTTIPFMLASPLSALGDWMLHGLPRTLVATATLLSTTPKPGAPAPAGTDLKSQISDFKSATPPPSPVTEKPSPVVFTPPAPPAVQRSGDGGSASSARRPSDVSDGADKYQSGVPVPDGIVAAPQTPANPQSAVPPASSAVRSPVATSVSEWPPVAQTPKVNTAPPRPAVSGIENRDSNTEAARPRTSAIENPPPFPSAPCAYALTSTGWSPLPRNGSTTIALIPHAPYPEDKQPAGSTELIVAELLFSGSEPAPSIPAIGGTLVYVGPLPARGATLPVEFGPLNVGTGIARLAPLTKGATGVPGLGPRRVTATLEPVSATVTVLHPTARLTPGRYALHCADQYFEVAVREKS